VALALLAASFPPGPALSWALGLWGVTAAAGGAVGVLVGGLLTESVGWWAVMLINVPFVVFALAAAVRVSSNHHERLAPRLDLAGAVLVTAGMSVLVLGVVRTREHAWGSPTTLVTLAAAAMLLAGFAGVEARATDPLLRLRLLARPTVLGANLFMMLLFSGQFAAFYFVSLYLHQVLGYGAAATGVAFLPFCLGVVVGSVVATRTVARFGLRWLLVAGGVVAAAGFGWFGLAFAAGGGFAAAILGPSLVVSIGIGLCVVPLGTAATAGVDPRETGMASRLITRSRQVGGSIGLAALDTLAAKVIGDHHGDRIQALGDGYGTAIGVAGALLALAAVVATVLIPGRRLPALHPGRQRTRRLPRPKIGRAV
jgi:predicted MFS family arabinose efflux permease